MKEGLEGWGTAETVIKHSPLPAKHTGPGGACECACLTGAQAVQVLLVLGTHSRATALPSTRSLWVPSVQTPGWDQKSKGHEARERQRRGEQNGQREIQATCRSGNVTPTGSPGQEFARRRSPMLGRRAEVALLALSLVGGSRKSVASAQRLSPEACQLTALLSGQVLS